MRGKRLNEDKPASGVVGGVTPPDLSPVEQTAAAREDLETSTLAQFPSDFSRLVYLSSLRDFSSNEYIHWGLENTYGKDAAQKALYEIHRCVFRDVCTIPLRELARQVKQYLQGQEKEGKILLRNWQQDFSYNLLAPPRLSRMEIENFRISFEAVLAAIARKGN